MYVSNSQSYDAINHLCELRGGGRYAPTDSALRGGGIMAAVRGSFTHQTFNGHIGVILAVGMDISQPLGIPRDTFDPSDLHWYRFIHEVQLHRNPLVFGAALRKMQSY